MSFIQDPLFSKFAQQHMAGISAKSIQAVTEMVGEGATVPFMARYRKEKTGNLDEVQIRQVVEGVENFQEIVKRKEFLLKEIGEQGNLTEEIKKRIELSIDLGELEEIYRPFKKKKKTKATLAREAGLEPLATWLWEVGHGITKADVTMEVKAKTFLNLAAGIASYDLALKGAQDILVEKIANEPGLRALVAKNFMEQGKVTSKRAKGFKPHSKYEMYSEFEEPVKSLQDAKASHRYLAMRRGWQEEELTVEVVANEALLLAEFEKFATTTPDNSFGEYLKQCAKLALTVYVVPSAVNEVHRILKEKADTDAIRVFAENVRKVLLGSPFGARCVLGVDPGLKTGCKVALVDKSGAYISHTVMHTLGEGAETKARTLVGEVAKQIRIDAIAVGNGTAGRQTEVFLRKIVKELNLEIPVIMVNESGASVYSASDVARAEFPDLDVTVRGAISIARRLQDPLSELVKIDPKSIGVGQYQHDVAQSQLKKSLHSVVESCVNVVGVDLNTASTQLLSFVSGIGPTLAQNIIEFRKKQLFQERSELLKVPSFGPKAFEQAAGFLRIPNGKVFLDRTGIHPERYSALRDMAVEVGVPITELVGEGAEKLEQVREKYVKAIGEFTFEDIKKELKAPGRDPREGFQAFAFRDDIFEVKDLVPEMICPGIVTNVTNFGAFVDIGVHQDGLVHISELAHKFVNDPRSVVQPGDFVKVRVLAVDKDKNQISLSMRLEAAPASVRPTEQSNRSREPRAEGQNNRNHAKSQQSPRGARPQGGGKPNSSPGDRPNNDRRPGGAPFNNPFAALQGIGAAPTKGQRPNSR